MLALIDADIVSFSCAAYNEEWGWEACREDIDQLMKRILETTGADDYEAFISGGNNFRYRIFPDYKANRKGKPQPIYRAEANAYLVTEYGAKVTDGYEADDGIGIATNRLDSFIICSIDKDLKQIAGEHYNWRKNEFDTVSVVEGLRSFYRSVLTGDRTDNIISGLHRMGPVTAGKLINNLEDEWEMYETVKAVYNDDERLHMNCQLLYILREENKMWGPPVTPKETY